MHPTESDLLALVHDECSTAHTAAMRAHLVRCEGCRSRYAPLAETDRMVGALIACLDQPTAAAPVALLERPVRAGYSRAVAAGIAILLTAAGAAIAAVPASPFRSWIRSFTATQAAAPPIRPVPAPLSDGVTIAVDTAVHIILRRPQTTGDIRLTRTELRTATVRAFGGDVSYTVSPGRIVLDNRAPAVRVEISLPRRARAATLVVGDRVLWRLSGAPGVESAADSVLIFALSDSTSTVKSHHP